MNNAFAIAAEVCGIIAITVYSDRFHGDISGNISCFVLCFISHFFTFQKIWQNNSTVGFYPHPYLAVAVLNCALWVLYGIPQVSEGNVLVLIGNAIGLLLALSYLVVFAIFSDMQQRLVVVAILGAELVFMLIVAVCTFFGFHSITTRTRFVGGFSVAFAIFLNLSYVPAMVRVVRTKNVEFMPISVCLAVFFNGLVWCAVSLLQFDLFIMLGNSLGVLLGGMQLLLYTSISKDTPTPRDEEAGGQPHAEPPNV